MPAKEKFSRKDAKIAKAQRRVKASDAPEGFDPPLRSLRLCVKNLFQVVRQPTASSRFAKPSRSRIFARPSLICCAMRGPW